MLELQNCVKPSEAPITKRKFTPAGSSYRGLRGKLIDIRLPQAHSRQAYKNHIHLTLIT